MGIFAEISILIAVATIMAAIMRFLHQPLIIGHILTGLIVGPMFFNLAHSTETLALMGQIGVAILLFTVGLHLRPEIIREFGRVSVITGIGQVLFTSAVGIIVCLSLGFDIVTAFYVGVALCFSSTIIIMKLIADKGDLDVLYAKIAVGFLLVQDLVAVLLLLGIPLLATEHFSWVNLEEFIATGIVLIIFVTVASRFFVSHLGQFIAQSQEFLFLFAIAWGIGIAALFKGVGFSLESGALIAGVSLASLPARQEISSRLTPLRDFFVVIFFIFLGSQMQFGGIDNALMIASILSLLVFIGNPLIMVCLLGYLGYRKKTSFQTAMTVAQVSEFSLILVALGVSMGHIASPILSLVTLVGIITIFGSTYMVLYSDTLYRLLSPYLGIFERATAHEKRGKRAGHSIILFGCNRIGYDFIDPLRKLDPHFLVVDYNPDTIETLKSEGIATEYGDAGDVEFLDSIDFTKVEFVISTIPDADVNQLIHRAVKSYNPEAIVLVVAHRISDALSHYDEGVDYVILPHFLGGQRAAEIVVKHKDKKSRYKSLRKEHIEYLQLRIAVGHEHPSPRAHLQG